MEELTVDPFRAACLVLRLRQDGVTDDGVLRAMETVDRGAFVEAADLKALAFADCALPIPCGQVIPRPTVTGHLLQALDLGRHRDRRVLVVGMGAGYTAALIGRLAADVFGVERYDRLTDHARQRIVALGLDNIAVRHGDGALGWPERGPYDRILLTGQVPAVPDGLLAQLAPEGFIIAPMQLEGQARIARVTADGTITWLGAAGLLPPLSEGRSATL